MGSELWYGAPAEKWIEALPLGNGRVGVMLYGGTETETFELNEETLWSGFPSDHNEPGCAPYYRKARELARKGDYSGAQSCIEEHMTGEFTEAYLPLGQLRLHWETAGEAVGYRRSLDLENAVHYTSYEKNGVRFRQEAFVSCPDQVFVFRADSEGGTADLSLELTTPLRGTCTFTDGMLHLEGICPSHVEPDYVRSDDPIRYDPAHPGVRFHAIAAVRTDGTASIKDQCLRISNSRETEVFFAVRTNFLDWKTQPEESGIPYRDRAERDIRQAMAQTYAQLKERHCEAHRALFDRASIQLGPNREDLPTDERLRRYAASQDDPGFAALLFDYGRYLLISSSRPGGMPANLQGIWNANIRPVWSCNYTTNINLEMNYWPALSCGLEETAEPLYRMIRNLARAGQETAAAYYGASGFCVHHNTDIWCHTNPVGRRRAGGAVHDYWPMAGGWLTGHLYQYWRYSGDRRFLRETAYPCLKEAARFFLDLLEEDGEGYLAVMPATSPENKFYTEGKVCGVSKTSTMNDAIVRGVFAHTRECAAELETDADFCQQLARAEQRLRPYRVAPDGRLMEWNEAFEEVERTHRHISHLYGLYPEDQITCGGTPELAQACRKTLEARTDEGTGWSLGWKLCLWARLRDGNHALRLLKQQMHLTAEECLRHTGGGTYPNLLGAHPPFQIDGNFGLCAGIVEMLVQDHENVLELLPALPDTWQNGTVNGIRAGDGTQVGLKWENGHLREISLTAREDRVMDLICRGRQWTVRLYAGKTWTWKEQPEC